MKNILAYVGMIALVFTACESREPVDPSNNGGNGGGGGGSQVTIQAKQRALVIEHTGAWCQYCPRGAYTLAQLSADHGNNLLALSVHNGDPLETAHATEFYNEFQPGGFPEFFVGSTGDVSEGQIDGMVTTIKGLTPLIGVGATATVNGNAISIKGAAEVYVDTAAVLYMNAYFINGPEVGTANNIWGNLLQVDNGASDWLTDVNDTSFWNADYFDGSGDMVIAMNDPYLHEHALLAHASSTVKGVEINNGAVASGTYFEEDFVINAAPNYNLNQAEIFVVVWTEDPTDGSLIYLNGVKVHL